MERVLANNGLEVLSVETARENLVIGQTPIFLPGATASVR
jgi:hypothetical protein